MKRVSQLFSGRPGLFFHEIAFKKLGEQRSMIKAVEVSKCFGPITAVDHVSFSVNKGEVLGFLGANGAGKSTTMRMITGFLPLSGGKIYLGGFDIEEHPLCAKKQIGYLPENAPSYTDMSVISFLNFTAALRGFDGVERSVAVEKAIATCHLDTVRYQLIDTLSKGYRHRVCFAQAILHDPPVLILDEPTDGLDPNQKHEMRELIKEMGKTKAIIVSTHILEEVEAICTRVIIIDKGRLVFNGTPQELLDRSPEAGRLVVCVQGEKSESVEKTLGNVGGVGAIKVQTLTDGRIKAVLSPEKRGTALASQVKSVLDQKGWQYDELHTETGKLDEVFRNLTCGIVSREVSK